MTKRHELQEWAEATKDAPASATCSCGVKATHPTTVYMAVARLRNHRS